MSAPTFPAPEPYRSSIPPTFPPPPPYRADVAPAGREPRWRRRTLTALLGGAVVAAALAGYGPAAGVLGGFLLLSPIERVFRRHPWKVRRPQLRTDVLHLLLSGALLAVAVAVGIVVVYLIMWPIHRGDLSGPLTALPEPLASGLGFVLLLVGNYWYHRASHEIPLFWRFHAVHHSSQHLDWIAAARLHPAEGFWGVLVLGPPLVLLGVQPVELGAFSVLINLWGLFLHANVSWRLAFLDGIIGTPEHHHWHHADDPAALNTNYSGLLPPLDRIFGTYYRSTERRPEVYGIGEPLPDSWWAQMRWPFRRTPAIATPVDTSVARWETAPGTVA